MLHLIGRHVDAGSHGSVEACVCCACHPVQVLASVKEGVEAAEKTIASWAEDKPWINENDTNSAVEKVGPLKPGQGVGSILCTGDETAYLPLSCPTLGTVC